MGETNIPNKFMNFEKEVFDDSYTAMWNLQQQTEKIAQNLISQQAGQSDDVAYLLNEWIGVLQKESRQFRETTDAGYKKMQSFFSKGENKTL